MGFKTELNPNNQQKTLLAKHSSIARLAYNWGLWLTKNILNHNSYNPESQIKFPTGTTPPIGSDWGLPNMKTAIGESV
ncbi:MAG: helix-turn-helix domain-containing protein [Microcoleaceae cyanobacterium]